MQVSNVALPLQLWHSCLDSMSDEQSIVSHPAYRIVAYPVASHVLVRCAEPLMQAPACNVVTEPYLSAQREATKILHAVVQFKTNATTAGHGGTGLSRPWKTKSFARHASITASLHRNGCRSPAVHGLQW
jgi:hypothetical protein